MPLRDPRSRFFFAGTRRASAGVAARLVPLALIPLAVVLVVVGAPASSRADGPPDVAPTREQVVTRVLTRARDEVTRRVAYDSAYRTLTFRDGIDTGRFTYPAGDVDPAHGVCTDVVVRAFRAGGQDLQVLVHQDVLAKPQAYASFVRTPDANIDHRRVGPLMTYFERHARILPATTASTTTKEGLATYQPGDVVIWSFSGDPHGYPNHIGLVSDHMGPRGVPLVIHNMGPLPTEDDLLDAWTLVGHFRAIP